MSLLTLFGCGQKQDLPTIENFELNKYLGTWYEVQRLPNSFEKNLKCVTATYSLRDNGKINVYNKGVNSKTGKTDDITGYATVPNAKKPAQLKVTFFWPFGGDYYVIDLDSSYTTALVGVPNRKYLWLLSREPDIEESRLQQMLKVAKDQGFDVDALEKIKHDCD